MTCVEAKSDTQAGKTKKVNQKKICFKGSLVKSYYISLKKIYIYIKEKSEKKRKKNSCPGYLYLISSKSQNCRKAD